MILDKIIELALLEDLSLGDITSDTIFTPENRAPHNLFYFFGTKRHICSYIIFPVFSMKTYFTN